jgi:hypothetical protein
MLLAGAAVAAVDAWPDSWALTARGANLSDLAALPQAAALRHLGAQLLRVSPLTAADVEMRLLPRLAAGGLDGAIAEDRKTGTLVAVNGWQISESQALAGAWLVLNAA